MNEADSSFSCCITRVGAAGRDWTGGPVRAVELGLLLTGVAWRGRNHGPYGPTGSKEAPLPQLLTLIQVLLKKKKFIFMKRSTRIEFRVL